MSRCTGGSAGRLRQRLRDVDAEARDSDVVAHAEAGGVLELRILEVVERVADVEERGNAEVARQVARHLDRAGRQVLAADALLLAVGRVDFLRRKLVELEAAHAAVAAGEEALRGRQVDDFVLAVRLEVGRAELRAQVEVPAPREVEYALALEAELHERGVGAERGRRAAQLEVQPVGPRFATDDIAGQRGVADAWEYIEGGVAVAGAFRGGLVRQAHEQHALPAAHHLSQAGAHLVTPALGVADLFLDEVAGEFELLQRDVHHRDDIARAQLLDDGRAEQLDLQAVAVAIHAAVVPGEFTARLRVGAVAQAGGEAVPAIRLGTDRHRHGQRLRVDRTGLDVDGGEVLAVVERVLRAQQRVERIGIALLHAQQPVHRVVIDDVLGDLDFAIAVALASVHFDRRGRAPLHPIDDELVLRQARIEIAVVLRRPQQRAFHALVRAVIQPQAGLEFLLLLLDDFADRTFVGTGPADFDAHIREADRSAGRDVKGDAPVGAVLHGFVLDLGLVVAERFERGAGLGDDAPLQARHRFRRDVVALGVARQAEECADVVTDLLGRPGDVDRDLRLHRQGQQHRQQQGSAGGRSSDAAAGHGERPCLRALFGR